MSKDRKMSETKKISRAGPIVLKDLVVVQWSFRGSSDADRNHRVRTNPILPDATHDQIL